MDKMDVKKQNPCDISSFMITIESFTLEKGDDMIKVIKFLTFDNLFSLVRHSPRAPNDNFRKISVRNIFSKISCLTASPRIFEHLKNGIIAYF